MLRTGRRRPVVGHRRPAVGRRSSAVGGRPFTPAADVRSGPSTAQKLSTARTEKRIAGGPTRASTARFIAACTGSTPKELS
jgi:hypothetical protein